ncbi:hypothetical protein [Salisaeta longa]|uniref:hypothetical protein n=1 Tax=Salisaeta longa TaxID=503170 RepID=UPI0003B4F64F|nr:hypothetical protein [Salisaeta longa]
MLLLTGCFDEVSGPYDGPPQVAFAQVGGAYSAAVLEGSGVVGLTVELVGPQRSAPLTVNFQAEGGSAYSLPNGNSLTIPADSSSGTLAINVQSGVNDGATQVVELRLTGADASEVVVAENWSTFELQIVDDPQD